MNVQNDKRRLSALYESGKTKIENFLIANDISLGVMFKAIDTDSSGFMEYLEFKTKV